METFFQYEKRYIVYIMMKIIALCIVVLLNSSLGPDNPAASKKDKSAKKTQKQKVSFHLSLEKY